MIGREVLTKAMPEADVTEQHAQTATKLILDFAVKDIADLRDRMTHLLGLRLLDAIRDPGASASHLNAAMKWLEQTSPQQDKPSNPMLDAINNAKQAMQEGGKLPDLDEYAGDTPEA